MKETGGAAEDVTDDEIRDGDQAARRSEGIFAETAGGVTVGVAKKLIAAGKIRPNDSAVLCITGNGLKTLDAVVGHVGQPREIKPSLREFEALLDAGPKRAASFNCLIALWHKVESQPRCANSRTTKNSSK